MPLRAGLDWGGTSHAACIVDDRGGIVARIEARHDAAGLADLLARLEHSAPPTELPIAIERQSGLIVDALLAAGHPVVPIHPDVVKACRPRYRAAGGKSDPGDAYMLADILRELALRPARPDRGDGHRFCALMPASDAIEGLRALVRGRDDLVTQRVVLANQLRSLLDSFRPGAVTIGAWPPAGLRPDRGAAIDSPIALAFLSRYPTPDSAARLGEKRLANFMAQHACCGRRSAAQLLARLRATPAGLASGAEADAKGEIALAAEADVCPLNAAGVQPHASGKSRGVVFRWACNHRLRQAVTCFADNSRHASTWAAAVYNKARQRGCKNPHAVRILARAWIRILWRAWQNNKPYDPIRHAAAAKIAA
jgi:transposase